MHVDELLCQIFILESKSEEEYLLMDGFIATELRSILKKGEEEKSTREVQRIFKGS